MRFITAAEIFDGSKFLDKGAVLVLNTQGILTDISWDASIDQGRIEKLNGTITPGFVNSHCHTELSHLRGRIARHSGLPAFGKQVISTRNTVPKEEISEHIKEANNSMWHNGIVAVGDISNGADSFEEKAGSHIFYHTFIELIGLNPVNAQTVFEQGLGMLERLSRFGLKGSLAPHAPYSTSKELIAKIAQYNRERGLVLSIHNEESEEELKFFMGAPNGFEDLFKFLNIDISWFNAPGCTPLESYIDLLSGSQALLVHNRLTSAKALNSAVTKNIYWCFCPGANLYIDDRLPDFGIFAPAKHRTCLGTDSLASNSSLDLLQEANLLLAAGSTFSTEDILRAMTSQGAAALGIGDQYGSLIRGRNAGLNLLQHDNKQFKLLKKIT